jgi:hypothetical protein
VPSLADIPYQYIREDRKLDFLAWLTALPCDIYEKRALMKLWASASGATFAAEHWNYIERDHRRSHEG